MTNFFNPKLTEFTEANKELSILGLFWAMYWRFLIVIFGICMVVAVLSAIYGS